MAFVYILESQSSRRYYVGSTNDLDRRLSEHLRNHTPSTRRRGPWTLVHQETFPTLLQARRRELEIKRWKSAKLIRELDHGGAWQCFWLTKKKATVSMGLTVADGPVEGAS